jgi:diguanylate cyclase (GGDEF)-like protein
MSRRMSLNFLIGRARVLAAALALCAPCAVLAQQYTFRQYGQQDGLSNLDISALMQDRAGYVWLGTENGLFRHDSAEFERFDDTSGLADTAIRSVIEDVSGRVWVGTAQDLYVLEGSRFHAVRPDGHEISMRAGVRLAAPARNRLLVIDKESLLELWSARGADGWHWRPYFTDPQVKAVPGLAHLSSLYVERSGRLWLGCGEAICSVDHRQVRRWGAASGVPEDDWHSWLLDSHGDLWVRGLRHVVVLGRGASSFESRDTSHVALTGGILNVPLIEDPQHRIITRSDAGLMRWDRDHWEELTADNGLTTPEISALLASRDGTVWLGTSGHGLWRWLGYGNFESWSARQGPSSNPVWAVLRGPDGAITIGTRAGCMHIGAASHLAVPCRLRGIPAGEMQVMAKGPDGTLWLGMATGQLLRVAPGETAAIPVGAVPQTRKLFVDASGQLWICSNGGIRLIRPGSTRVQQAEAPPGLGEVADAAQDARGAVWFATQAGLLRWWEGRWTLIRLPVPAPDGFAAVAPASDGWLWAGGASHGLIRVHVRGTRADEAQWIRDSHVAHAAAYFTQVDSRGWLWVGTDDGFVLFDGRSWRKFGQPDGLIWNDTDQNAVFADADGSMWIGTSGGLTHVLRPERLLGTEPLNLQIAQASIGGTELRSGSPAKLPWSPALALDLHLSDLDFGATSSMRLRVRLRGLSDDWFDSRHFDLHYPALGPERYTFEAIAVDSDHQRSSPVVSLSFEVLPPWWQTLWFRLVMATAIVAAVAAAWRWSVRRHEARRRQLEHELQERQELLERATRDPLTKLWNRQAILDMLARELDAARHSGKPIAIAIIDVDHFKRINDTMGHLAGDEVLRTLGARLARSIRSRDALGRYGGEELLMVLPEASPQRPFLPVERLRQVIAETPFSYEGTRIAVTASFGVAWIASAEEGVEELLARADQALYAAKAGGRDRVEYAPTAVGSRGSCIANQELENPLREPDEHMTLI